MTELIKSQAGVVIVMTYCGLCAYLIYDFFSLFISRFVKKSKALKIALRIFGYIIIGMLTADFSMYCQNGKITFTGLVCFVIGLWLWRKFFYDIINGQLEAREDAERTSIKMGLNIGEEDEQKGEKAQGV